MNTTLNVILIISFIASLSILGYKSRGENNNALRFYFLFILLLIPFYFFLFGFPFGLEELDPKGSDNNHVSFIIKLFVSVVVGILFQFLYTNYSIPKKERPPFDLGLFLAPIFTSPIIIIPLYAAFQNAEIDLSSFDQKSIMIYLVAFENGFFWKAVLTKRESDLKK